MAIEQTINTIIDESRTYASDMLTEANELLEAAVRVSDNKVTFNTPDFNFDPADITADLPEAPIAPTLSPSDTATAPTVPTFESLQMPEVPRLPQAPAQFNASGLFQHIQPSGELGEVSGDVPNVRTTFDLPAAPTLSALDLPTASEVEVRSAPSITLPVFEAKEIPEEFLNDYDFETTFADQYTSFQEAMAANVEDRRLAMIEEMMPGYRTQNDRVAQIITAGLSENSSGQMHDSMEDLIYARARDRMDQERTGAYKKIENDIKGRGFPIPPGLMQSVLVEVEAEGLRAVARAAAETAVERDKLERKYGEFLLQMSVTMQKDVQDKAMQYSEQLLAINGQSLEYAKGFLANIVQGYNLAVEAVSIKLRVSEAAIAVFETETKSAMADMEMYRIEVEAAKLQGDVDQTKLGIYEAALRGEAQKIQNYVAQIEAVSTEANLEKVKVDLYGEQVRAFATKVGAKEAEFRAYEAAIRGDEAQVKAYVAQVDAYRSEVAAVGAVAEIDNTIARTTTAYNASLTEQFKAEIAAYNTELSANQSEAKLGLDAYRAGLEGYKAMLALRSEEVRTALAQDELSLKASATQYDGMIKAMLARAERDTASVKLTTDASISAAKVLHAAASSAVSSQNSMVQLYAKEA